MRKQKTGKDLGSADIVPGGNFIVNHPYSWNIVYIVGNKQILPGGGLRIVIPYGFTMPQIHCPTGMGFTTAETSCLNAKVSIHLQDPFVVTSIQPSPVTWGNFKDTQDTFGVYIYVTVHDAILQNADKIFVNYGGKGLNEGALTRYFEGIAQFTVFVDTGKTQKKASERFLLLDSSQPEINLINDKPAKLKVTLPSIIQTSEKIPVKVSVRDCLENSIPDYNGSIILESPIIEKQISNIKNGVLHKNNEIITHAQKTGILQLKATSTDNENLNGLSNPAKLVSDSPEVNLYWGDLHVMTEISAGLSRPDPAYRYARDVSHLDFCAVTDGDDWDSYFSDEEWEETKEAVKKNYDSDRFVTILASEYHERKVAGDKNIYFREDTAPLIRWSDLKGPQPNTLWKALKKHRALTIPHHTTSNSYNCRPWEFHHPDYQRLVEIYSVWGNAEAKDTLLSNYWVNNYENSVRNGLAKGYRMGIVASGDSHDGLSGNSNWMRIRKGYRNGLAAVYADNLSRETIFDALWDRYCYGTTGSRIILFFNLNKAHMGQEISGEENKAERNLSIDVIGTNTVSEVTVIRNSKEVFVEKCNSSHETIKWQDKEDFDKVCLHGYDGKSFIYYYVRIVQVDSEIAWSSPIWIS